MNARIELLGILGNTTLLAVLVASCGGGGTKPVTAADFCDQKAEKECQIFTKCVVPEADCKAERVAACLKFAADAQTAIGTIAPRIFRTENVAECVNLTGSTYAKANITPAEVVKLTDTCNYVYQGSVEKDGHCNVNYDCKDKNVVCDKTICAAKVSKALDAFCTDPGAVCVAGSYCTKVGDVTKCVARKANGETCDATTPCLEALRCSAGMCTARVGINEACASNADCPTGAPYCDPYVNNKCDLGLSFSGNSPSCGDYGGTGTTGAAGTSGGTAGTSGGAAGTSGGAGSGGAGSGGAGSGGATGAGGAAAILEAGTSDGAAD